jgi:hypothetical protein
MNQVLRSDTDETGLRQIIQRASNQTIRDLCIFGDAELDAEEEALLQADEVVVLGPTQSEMRSRIETDKPRLDRIALLRRLIEEEATRRHTISPGNA